MATRATAADVTNAWIGPGAPTDTDLVELWLGRAERYLVPQLPTDAPPDPDTVRDVLVSMVMRVFRNPEGYRTRTAQQSTGQFSRQDVATFGGEQPGGLYLTDEERTQLSIRTGRKRKAYSVMPRYR